MEDEDVELGVTTHEAAVPAVEKSEAVRPVIDSSKSKSKTTVYRP